MKMCDILPRQNILAELRGTSMFEVLEELAGLVVARCPEVGKGRLVEVLLEREKRGSTAIGEGIAIPHGKVPRLPGVVAAFGRSRFGVDFQSLDGGPTQLFVLLVAPEDVADAPGTPHLEALARVSRLLRYPEFRRRLLEAEGAQTIYEIIREQDDKDV
jgi:PTS system nitrogen regulatory IIA component